MAWKWAQKRSHGLARSTCAHTSASQRVAIPVRSTKVSRSMHPAPSESQPTPGVGRPAKQPPSSTSGGSSSQACRQTSVT